MFPPLDVIEVPARDPLPLPGGLDDLARRSGAVAFRLRGRSRGPSRVAVTLLHGNEPSGARAMLRLLGEGLDPAVDSILVLGALEAATAQPPFSHRFLPGRRDRNRVFGAERRDGARSGDPDFAFASALLELVAEAPVEALVDIHNNTGHNPAYGIATSSERDRLGLVSLFADRAIVTDLDLKTLMEATDGPICSVSIEVGRAGDELADQVAYEGLKRFLENPELPSLETPMTLYSHPIRVELAAGTTVAFSRGEVYGSDLVFSEEIDRHNFSVVGAGTPLARFNGSSWPLVSVDGSGRDISRELFAIEDGVLLPQRDIVPIMMTLDPRVAAQDCLFYLVVGQGQA